MLTDCQSDMFRLSLGHLQTLWENRSKSYLYFNALWDPKCLEIILQVCKIYSCIIVYYRIVKYIPVILYIAGM